MTKGYTVLLQILVVWWAPECFVEDGAGSAKVDFSNYQHNYFKRKGYTTTAWEGRQKTLIVTC